MNLFKSWTVDISTQTGGGFEYFYTKKQALQYALEHWNDGLYLDIKNSSKNIKIRIKDNPDAKQGDEKCEHHWVGEFGQVRCDKCEASINTACNHTGSVGCLSCNQEFADELNDPDPDSKLDKDYHKWEKKGDFCNICGLPLKNNSCSNQYCKPILEQEVKIWNGK